MNAIPQFSRAALHSVRTLLDSNTYRQHWAKRELPQIHSGEFDGELMKVGATYIARRPAIKDCSRTIICFPGFLEDMRYFQDVYKDNAAELILVNNANYHCPFPDNGLTELEWPENPYEMGTIEHDGFYLGLVLERLATGTEVCLHGHSRGGAVVLETGRQYPELTLSKTRAVSALLEAAVLPQARTAGNGSKPLPHRIICYLLPIILGRSRHNTAEQLLKNPMMHPTNTLKTQMCLSMYSTSRSYNTCVANVQSIVRWQRATDFERYKNYAALTVLIGARDAVLNNRSMQESAEQGRTINPHLTIIKTENTNHFISLEQPETIQAIH
jgi:pimeloyl-ACP methyl ester carboxylesterase